MKHSYPKLTPPNFKLTAKPLSTLTITSESGLRQLPKETAPRIHAGIDFGAANGTNVFAAHNGTIIKSSWSKGYGNLLVIRDEITNMLTFYAHLSKFLVTKVDKKLESGSLIAKSGNSGTVAFHLHFEVRDGNYKIGDKLLWQVINGSSEYSLDVKDQGYLNPRPLLADLALDISKTELGFGGIPDILISEEIKKQIELRSSEIFSCDVIAQNSSIWIESDRRNNSFRKITINKKDLEFLFPDSANIGFDVIEAYDKTKKNKLIIDGQEVLYQTSQTSCMIDADGTLVRNKWVMNHNGKNYALLRVNEQGQVDDAGADLLILPSINLSGQNAIKIRNFSFRSIQKDGEGEFGLNLEIINPEPHLNLIASEEFGINSYTSSSQQHSSVARLNNGNFVVTWQSNRQQVEGGIGDGIYIQILDQNGNKIGAESKVNYYSNSPQSRPVITALTNGGFAIAWTKFNYDQSYNDVVIRTFDSAGNKVGNEVIAISTRNGNQYNPSITFLANGNFVVAWQGDAGWSSGTGIYARIFNSFGVAQGLQFEVRDNYNQGYPSLATLSNGNFVVIWSDQGQYTIAQIYNENGVKIGDRFQVNTNNQGQGDYTNPTITSLNDGKFIVAWKSASSPYPGENVIAQIFDQSGNKIGVEFQVNTQSLGIQAMPSITLLSDGKFIITWQSEKINDGSLDVIGQVFDQSGNKIGDQFQINSYNQSDQSLPSVTSLPDNKFVVTWTSDGQDGSSTGIYAKIFTANTITPTCTSLTQISSSNSPQSFVLEQGITYIGGGNNFIIPNKTGTVANPLIYRIGDFRLQGDDRIDLSGFIPTTKKQPNDKQVNELQLSVFSRDKSTVIAVNGYNVEIILQDYNINQFQSEYVTSEGISIVFETMTVENLNQSLIYDQINATIALQDLKINTTNTQAVVDVNLILVDVDSNIISDPNQLLIQVGETDLGSVSTFTDGIWHANGTVAEVNNLLSDLKLELGQGFEENFRIDIEIIYNGNQILRTNSEIEVNYQCQQLPPAIQELINSQTTEAGQELLLDMVRYFYDPNNPNNPSQLIFNIQDRIEQENLKQDGCIDIQALNQTAFKIILSCGGNYNLTATAENYCKDIEYQDFDIMVNDLLLSPTTSPDPSNSGNYPNSTSNSKTSSDSISRTAASSKSESVTRSIVSSFLPSVTSMQSMTRQPANSPSLLPQLTQDQTSNSSSGNNIIIGASVGGAALLLLTALCYIYKNFSNFREVFTKSENNSRVNVEMSTSPGTIIDPRSADNVLQREAKL